MQINTKFNQGDTVWFLADGKSTSGKVVWLNVELKRDKKLDITYKICRDDLPKSNYRNEIVLSEPNIFESETALRDYVFPNLKA